MKILWTLIVTITLTNCSPKEAKHNSQAFEQASFNLVSSSATLDQKSETEHQMQCKLPNMLHRLVKNDGMITLEEFHSFFESRYERQISKQSATRKCIEMSFDEIDFTETQIETLEQCIPEFNNDEDSKRIDYEKRIKELTEVFSHLLENNESGIREPQFNKWWRLHCKYDKNLKNKKQQPKIMKCMNRPGLLNSKQKDAIVECKNSLNKEELFDME